MHTQGCQGCQNTINFVRNSKILIARSTVQLYFSRIKNHWKMHQNSFKKWQIVFDFTQFWLDGRPGNEYFWISHKIYVLLTPLTPLDVYPQWFETDMSHSSYSAQEPPGNPQKTTGALWNHRNTQEPSKMPSGSPRCNGTFLTVHMYKTINLPRPFIIR